LEVCGESATDERQIPERFPLELLFIISQRIAINYLILGIQEFDREAEKRYESIRKEMQGLLNESSLTVLKLCSILQDVRSHTKRIYFSNIIFIYLRLKPSERLHKLYSRHIRARS